MNSQKLNAMKKITEEFKILNLRPLVNLGITVGLSNEDNTFEWRCFLLWPKDTFYKGGFFILKIIFPDDYPIVPPKFIFISKIFHPNISEEGFVSCDILQNGWSPGLNEFFCLIYSVQSLLDDPNANDFLNESAAKLWKENRNIYNETVREYTSIFANYSKFLEDIKHMNIKIIINEKRKKFRFLEE